MHKLKSKPPAKLAVSMSRHPVIVPHFSPFQHPSPLIFPVYKRKSPAFAGLFRQTGASKRVPFFHFCRPCTAHSASALFVSRILNWHFDLQDAWIWALYSPSTGLPTMYTQPLGGQTEYVQYPMTTPSKGAMTRSTSSPNRFVMMESVSPLRTESIAFFTGT